MARKAWSIGHELHAAILDQWHSGKTATAISAALDVSVNRISMIVVRARSRGDFRAVHHYRKSGVLAGRYLHRPLVPSRPVSSTIGISHGRDDSRSAVRPT